MTHTPTRKAIFTCEVCRSRLIKRTSALLHPHLRHDLYICSNPLCSASYSGHTELTGIASPSGVPNAPASDLPPTPAYERALAERSLREAVNGLQPDIFDAPLSTLTD